MSMGISELMEQNKTPSDTIEPLKQKYTELAAVAGDKGFVLKVLEQEIQSLHQQMFNIQKDIAALSAPAPTPEPPAAA
jgi:hypothetical protein